MVHLARSGRNEFDYVVVGGGTAGAVVASRLAEAKGTTVCLIEAGPSDEDDNRILELRHWPLLLGTELDFDYEITPQERGNGRIRHSRGRVLGGSSSHNSAIAFRASDVDMETWERLGAEGWGPATAKAYFDRVLERVHLQTAVPDNACTAAFIEAAHQAGYPLIAFNQEVLREGVGWFQLNARGSVRQSSSVAYLHPLRDLPSSLTVLTNTTARRIILDERGEAIGIEVEGGPIFACCEVVLCCGTFDTPKLLLLSGIGPPEHLRQVGVPVVHDRPAVGEHLLDHPEGLVMWESARPVPEVSAQEWEAGLFACSDPSLESPDVMFHFGVVPFDINTKPLGYPTAEDAFCMTPNVMYARSEGTVRLRSSDPRAAPVIDPRYFTDPDGYDERVMLAGVKLARSIATQPAMQPWVKRELAPGPSMQTDVELSEYARRTGNTVYHPAGTCRMGRPNDPRAVVDSELRVNGVGRLRVADASVFPAMTGVNPCITCMMIGERCADLLLGRAPPAVSEEVVTR